MAVSTDPANNVADIAVRTQQSITSPTVSFGWTPYPSRPASEAKSRHLSLDVKIGSSDFNTNHRAGPVPGPNALRNDRAICVDFDEVFASSMLALIVAHNQQYGTDFTMSVWPYNSEAHKSSCPTGMTSSSTTSSRTEDGVNRPVRLQPNEVKPTDVSSGTSKSVSHG